MNNEYKWPSTDNIGKVLQEFVQASEYEKITQLFNEPVLITEKLDGQNLSRVYSPKLQSCIRWASRNQILANPSINGENFSMLEIFDTNIKQLYEATKHIYDPNNNIDEFIIVGELLLQSTNYKAISFNKFNYHNDQIEWRVFGILTVTYDNDQGSRSHYYLNKLMYNQFIEYNFVCPKIFFEGVLRDGIVYMDQIMDMTMEGCVITSFNKNGSNNFNYKYKIGYYDDRKNGTINIDIGTINIDEPAINQNDISIIKMVELMYDRARPPKGTKKITKKDIKDDNAEVIESNVNSEFSKRDIDISLYAGNSKKDARDALIKDIANTIQSEIIVDRAKLVKAINAALGLKLKHFFNKR